ncbi:MAG: carboxymuconolactone decarboxylase family protein [Desulfobacteraceae bacterium]|jgi:AhpD family alkylhydroperoxidase|nr:MAG: carboxymuconolactone decarboxylase family protein [Desulfobacteraceae bacterium]
MGEQTALNQKRLELIKKFRGVAPEFMAAEFEVLQKTYQDGALSIKVKRLMSLAIALRAGCTNCILAQTQYALDSGASRQEIVETLQVVTAMSGTTGIAESLRVVEFLDEKGML